MIEKTKSRPSGEWLAAQNALMQAIDFNEDDLDANRGGYMSKKQRATLSRYRAGWLDGISYLFLLLAGVFVYVVIAGILTGGQFGTSVMAFGAFALLGGSVLFFMWFKYFRLNADLHKGDIYLAEGQIALYIEKKEYQQIVTFVYHANIDGKRFIVDHAVYVAFTDDEPYAIYYAPNTNKILSAEWLHKREMAD